MTDSRDGVSKVTKARHRSGSSDKISTANILIVEEDKDATKPLLETFAKFGIRGTVAVDKKRAMELLEKERYDLIFMADRIAHHAQEPECDEAAFDLLKSVRAWSPEMPVVMIGQRNDDMHQQVQRAVTAIRRGCCDYLVRPFGPGRVKELLETFVPNNDVQDIASAQDGPETLYRIVGKSPRMYQTVNLARRVAGTSVPVLISGESGTGKELVSYLVHQESKRSGGPYISVNCAALSENLLESELFGHEKGAFTGAHAQRKGRFEMAHGGTLLLDEISETPVSFQAKLLRVLEQQDFQRVGGNRRVKVDVRIISTTNRNLPEEVRAGRFRQDLYYRLSGVRLVIAPLRQRPEDLKELVWYFVNVYSGQTQRRIKKLDPAMMEIFLNYSWPGNVRQLRNVVLTSLILGVGQTLSLADVSWLFDEFQPLCQENDSSSNAALTEQGAAESPLAGVPLDELEQQAIVQTLRQMDGNRTKAARQLGISDRTLRGKLRRYKEEGVLQIS